MDTQSPTEICEVEDMDIHPVVGNPAGDSPGEGPVEGSPEADTLMREAISQRRKNCQAQNIA